MSGIRSRWRLDGQQKLTQPPADFSPPAGELEPGGESFKQQLTATRRQIKPLQQKLYAGKQYSFLLIFQALDAAGKDGAIREVLEGLDPAGLNVSSFKRPTDLELAHDFLWRTSLALPERGRIGAFNRSYYEEVLTVRVHPEFLDAQFVDERPNTDALWLQRYRAIREHERHLASSNTVVLKFWLNVSPARQAQRFIERLEDPAKQWKFSARDIKESGLRAQYDQALMHMLNETSRPWAPWFCIPADNRWYARAQIAGIVHQALERLPLAYPQQDEVPASERDDMLQLLSRRLV